MAAVNRMGAELVTSAEPNAHLALAVLQFQIGFAERQARHWPQAAEAFREAAVQAELANDADAAATAVESTGLVYWDEGRPDEAEKWLSRNLDLALAIGKDRRTALARFHLAKARAPEEAFELLDQAARVLDSESLNRAK